MILHPAFPDRRSPEQKRQQMWRELVEVIKRNGLVFPRAAFRLTLPESHAGYALAYSLATRQR